MCYRFDTSSKVWRVLLKAYTASVLVTLLVLCWTAGDACLYFGNSYLESRYYRS